MGERSKPVDDNKTKQAILENISDGTTSIYPNTDYNFNQRWQKYQLIPLIDKYKNYYQNTLQKRQNGPEIVEPAEFDDKAFAVETDQKKLQSALQWLYQAQAAEKWEEEAIQRTEQIADDARDALDKATDDVRMKSADLQRAREKASQAAGRARTAIVSLSAHDQLMNRARQLIYGLTAQVITIQSQLLEEQQKYIFNDSKIPFEPKELNDINLSKSENDYIHPVVIPSNLNENYMNWNNPVKRAQRLISNNVIIPQRKPSKIYSLPNVPFPVGFVNKCPLTIPQPYLPQTFLPQPQSFYCVQPCAVNKQLNSWQKVGYKK